MKIADLLYLNELNKHEAALVKGRQGLTHSPNKTVKDLNKTPETFFKAFMSNFPTFLDKETEVQRGETFEIEFP